MEHDCGVSDEILQVCFHPEEESQKWMLVTKYYLSGVEFDVTPKNPVTKTYPSICYIELGQDKYRLPKAHSPSESTISHTIEKPLTGLISEVFSSLHDSLPPGYFPSLSIYGSM